MEKQKKGMAYAEELLLEGEQRGRLKGELRDELRGELKAQIRIIEKALQIGLSWKIIE